MIEKNIKGQAVASKSIKMNREAFKSQDHTSLYWLGNAGILINSHGTNVMIDPLLKDFDMPLLIDIPLELKDVQKLDGVLITHIDNDHFSRPTCSELKSVCDHFYAPNYVADVMNKEGYPTSKYDIKDHFQINEIKVSLTPAWHNWQNDSKKWQYRIWEQKDYCGYWMETKDGTIWLPGDSRLLKEHLQMPEPDIILLDFADNEWHITLEGAIQLANTYPKSKLICIHWGCVDAPNMTPFNGNPENLYDRVINPERIVVLACGEEYTVEGK